MGIPILFSPASDSSLLVRLGDDISIDVHKRVARLTHLLHGHVLKGIRNIHPAYNSILVSFDPLQTDHASVEKSVRELIEQVTTHENEDRIIEIPTCYGDEFGPDLNEVSTHSRQSPEDVIRIHASVEYVVYFLGFSPGFPYLGGMPSQIAIPRLSIPRTSVPAGSVAIGGSQTGIYPVASPGGWRLIGRTPLRLFDPLKDPPTLLQIGNRVKFIPISKSDFHRLLSD